jgi:endonuclease YncB( thermonuclease family)
MRAIAVVFAVLAGGLLLAVPATAGEAIIGVASVIDGDTIEIHGQRIRLFGIDAMESAQRCQKAGKQYLCGKEAAFALADQIGSQVVRCEHEDIDRYKRVVATCSAGGIDLNQWMVARGQALAYRRYSDRYVPDEEKARAARLGIWDGEFQAPWNYRHGRSGRPAFPSAAIQPVMPEREQQAAPATGQALSDQAIIRILRERSLAGYSGSCPCPGNTDRAGRRCGARSAYSRPGGAAPLCYDSDVTPGMIAKYRRAASGR